MSATLRWVSWQTSLMIDQVELRAATMPIGSMGLICLPTFGRYLWLIKANISVPWMRHGMVISSADLTLNGENPPKKGS